MNLTTPPHEREDPITTTPHAVAYEEVAARIQQGAPGVRPLREPHTSQHCQHCQHCQPEKLS